MLTVAGKVIRVPGEGLLRVDETKSAAGRRTIPLPRFAVEMLMKRARDYIVEQRGIDASRLVIVNGGFREDDSVELWVVPAGAEAPRATPTIQAGDVKTRKRK